MKQTIQALMILRANITGKDPDDLLDDFIAKAGPLWEEEDRWALELLVLDQSNAIMELQQEVRRLQNKG